MYSSIQFLSVIIFFVLFMSNAEAQNKYPFNNDRSIKIGNRFRTSSQVSFHFQVQSTSTYKKNSGHGSYERILGASNYFFELADHQGQLAFYNGKTWYDLGIDIRKKKKDIFLIFDQGVVSIYDGNKLIATKIHRRKKFNCNYLFIGSTYSASEKFKGEIDFVMMHNRVLAPKEMAIISKGEIQTMIDSSPDLFYNFIDGKTYEKATNYRPFRIRLDYGMVSKNNFAPEKERVEPIVEAQEVFISEAKGEDDFVVKLSKVDNDNFEYKGRIMNDSKIIKPGNYDLIVKSDGTVIIKIKVMEDK